MLLLCLLAVVLMSECFSTPAASETVDKTIEEEIKQKVYATVSAEEEKGFKRKAPPKPGEWLYTVPESPQPFELYRATTRIRPTAERRTIVLLPMGEMNDEQKK